MFYTERKQKKKNGEGQETRLSITKYKVLAVTKVLFTLLSLCLNSVLVGATTPSASRCSKDTPVVDFGTCTSYVSVDVPKLKYFTKMGMKTLVNQILIANIKKMKQKY